MLFGWFKRGDKAQSNARNPEGHDFSEEERDKAHIARLRNNIRKEKIKYLKERLEQIRERQEEQILQLKVDDAERDLNAAQYADEESEDDAEEDDEDDLFSNLLGQFAPLLMQNKSPPVAPPPQAQKQHLSDDELRAYKAKVPALYLKQAKKMSDTELINLVSQYKPEFLTQYDEDTINRAIKILKE